VSETAQQTAPKRPVISRERMYQTILSPVVTEKATRITEQGQVVFRVPIEATKPEIKAAVEGLFGVTVVAVNTIIRKGKTKQFRGIKGKQQAVKKAIVRLAEGDKIDVTTRI
jgi:large subunit ribosomal protein L23